MSIKIIKWPLSQICANCINGEFIHMNEEPCAYICKKDLYPGDYGCDNYTPITILLNNEELPRHHIEEFYILTMEIVSKNDFNPGFLSKNQIDKLIKSLDLIKNNLK